MITRETVFVYVLASRGSHDGLDHAKQLVGNFTVEIQVFTILPSIFRPPGQKNNHKAFIERVCLHHFSAALLRVRSPCSNLEFSEKKFGIC
jgi:hypothetical protein